MLANFKASESEKTKGENPEESEQQRGTGKAGPLPGLAKVALGHIGHSRLSICSLSAVGRCIRGRFCTACLGDGIARLRHVRPGGAKTTPRT